MDRSPPPFFKQGPSANVRLAFFSLLAIALLIVAARFETMSKLRQGIATVLYPVQRTLLVPRDLAGTAGGYFVEIDRLRAENAEMRRIEAANARTLLQTEHGENPAPGRHGLLGMRERIVELHGELELCSPPGGGLNVRARLPLPQPRSPASR